MFSFLFIIFFTLRRMSACRNYDISEWDIMIFYFKGIYMYPLHIRPEGYMITFDYKPKFSGK